MMKFIRSMMISCMKATFLLVKKEERKLTLMEGLNLYIHLSMCEFCSAFEKQSDYISIRMKHIHSHAALSPEDKARIRESLEK